MSDRLTEIRARLDAYRKDGHYAVVCDHFTADDIAWLLDRVDALETELALSTESEVWAQVEAMRVRGEISSDGGERNA